ncbi:MAG: hypothetical protein NT076_02300 [Candidatus Pacearchaeota archaeon]|nr:hypothetical protein [Candidatus Pacearchaeota archaeon]
MKKRVARILGIVLVGLFLSLFLINVVSAASLWDNIKQAGNDIVSNLGSPTTEAFLQSDGFIKTLFFILVLLIIGTILSLIPLFKNKKGVSFLVAVIVSFLAVYYIPSQLIKSMLNPYSALGVALISVIPFIIIFLFAQHMLTNTFLKKVVWMFFAVFLLALTVYTSIPGKGQTAKEMWMSWVYGIVSILALLMVFFNGWIDKHIWSGQMETNMTAAERRMQRRIALDRLKEEEAEAQGV